MTLRLLYSVGLLDFEDKDSELDNIFTINNKLIKVMNYKKEIQQVSKINYYYINFNNLSDTDVEDFSAVVDKNISILKSNDYLNPFFKGIIIGPLLSNLGFNNELSLFNFFMAITFLLLL